MAKTFPGKQWGNDQSNANDTPDWRVYDATRGDKELTGNATANVVATGKGWELEYPDGLGGVGNRETLVAIGGLKMPDVTVLFMQDLSGVVGHTNAEYLKVRVQMSSGVVVENNAANVYIVAVGDDANTVNANLIFVAADSQPQSGVLVFEAGPLDLTSIDDNSTFTISNSATFHGHVISRKKKDGEQVANTTLGAGSANSVVITIIY